MGDEGVVLTERERQALAGLAESIGDPWLARQLVGQETPPPDGGQHFPRPVFGGRVNRAAASPAAAVFLVLAGAALAVTTFAHSAVVASLGLLMMGAGLWRGVADHGDVILRRLTERRIPAAGPPAPHTPPGAA